MKNGGFKDSISACDPKGFKDSISACELKVGRVYTSTDN